MKIPCCSVCQTRYNEEERCPLLLQCGHGFCKECLSRMFSASPDTTLSCPRCRHVSVVGNSVQALRKNYAILALINTSSNHSTGFDCDFTDDDEENGEDDLEDEEDESRQRRHDDEVAGEEHYTAKALNKKEKKRQEREAQRQVEEAARELRHTKQDRYAEMRRRKDEEHEERERQLEEEAKAQKAKEEEAAALEFEKWKGAFSVDAEGTTENDTQDGGQGLLFDFVEYIKKHKCIPLEDLAAEFKLRTQDCINRIASLENMGRLSGVMDDRGKYIYISLEEMQAVADYIKHQGRVSISHLAGKSNQFIDLESKAQFADEIGSIEEITAS